MNKIENLIVRACKSKNPDQRLQSVYRRFYCSHWHVSHMADILTEIVEDYNLTYLHLLASNLNPSQKFMFGLHETAKYDEHLYRVMLSAVRLCSVDKFSDKYIIPARFRKD